MSAAEEPFKIGDRQFNAGSFVIRSEGNPSDLRQRLEAAVVELGLTAHASDKSPAVKTHEMSVPRIAIVHSWINTQNEGWYRIEFDRYRIPYTYISDHVLRNTPNLARALRRHRLPARRRPGAAGRRGAADARRPHSVEAVGADAELRHLARPDRRHARRDGARGLEQPPAVRRGGRALRRRHVERAHPHRLRHGLGRRGARDAAVAGARLYLQRDLRRPPEPRRLRLRRDAAALLQPVAGLSGARAPGAAKAGRARAAEAAGVLRGAAR